MLGFRTELGIKHRLARSKILWLFPKTVSTFDIIGIVIRTVLYQAVRISANMINCFVQVPRTRCLSVKYPRVVITWYLALPAKHRGLNHSLRLEAIYDLLNTGCFCKKSASM